VLPHFQQIACGPISFRAATPYCAACSSNSRNLVVNSCSSFGIISAFTWAFTTAQIADRRFRPTDVLRPSQPNPKSYRRFLPPGDFPLSCHTVCNVRTTCIALQGIHFYLPPLPSPHRWLFGDVAIMIMWLAFHVPCAIRPAVFQSPERYDEAVER
jgi:hypothetical protein